jgi:hypothetical protein
MSAEHYLPAALGKFRGYRPLGDRVCRECNKKIGDAVETEFLRTGAIVFFRWLLGVSGRDGEPRSPFYRWAAGIPPIHMMGRAPGFEYDLLFEVERGTENVYPLRQVVFEHPLLARPRAVPTHDRMRENPEYLIKLLQEWGLVSGETIRIFAAPDEIPWVSDLLRKLGYAIPANWAVTEFPAQRAPHTGAWPDARCCRLSSPFSGDPRVIPVRLHRWPCHSGVTSSGEGLLGGGGGPPSLPHLSVDPLSSFAFPRGNPSRLLG